MINLPIPHSVIPQEYRVPFLWPALLVQAKQINGKVKIFLVIKDYRNKVVQIHVNIEGLDKYLKAEYTKEELASRLSHIRV